MMIETVLPTSDPQAKLMTPWPLKASQSVTLVVTTKLTRSASMRFPWANSRVISESGTAASPSMITQMHSSRSIAGRVR